MFRYLVILAVSVAAASALFSGGPDWNGLRAKFGIPNISGAYSELPRTKDDAIAAGFTLLDGQCTSAGQTFRGNRYVAKDSSGNNDFGVVLLFDKNGYIAGIQTSVSNSQYVPNSVTKNTSIAQDGSRWTLTAYFVDPTIICTTGRSADDFANEGTGTHLYLQNGTNPEKDFALIPTNEADIKSTKWGNGYCFPGMGQHYWFNVSPDMSCDDFFPYCVLYTNGKLNAFCFALDKDIENTNRYEHPDAAAAAQCCLNTPNCYNTDPRYSNGKKLSTMHVFMTEYPYLTNICL